jgi:hypothetical protein
MRNSCFQTTSMFSTDRLAQNAGQLRVDLVRAVRRVLNLIADDGRTPIIKIYQPSIPALAIVENLVANNRI